MAVTFLLNNLVGCGLGPLLAGALSDFYTRTAGAAALQYALLTTVAIGVPGVVPFVLTACSLESDLQQVEQNA